MSSPEPRPPSNQAPKSVSHREILALAIPNVLSNLTIPLLGFVDTAVCGRLDGLGPLGAVALGATAFQFLYWGFGFLRMGTTGLVAQALGEGAPEKGQETLARALLVSVVAGLSLILLQRPIRWVAFLSLATPPEILPHAHAYFDVRIWAAPASLALFSFHGWFLGMQNARWPLVIAVVSNLANAFLDGWFAAYLGWGAAGVAWGTLLSQYLGLGVALYGFRQVTGRWLPHISPKALRDGKALGRLASLSGDIAVRTVSMLAVLALFMARSAKAGPLVLAANSILMNVWSLHAYLVDGFAFAGESLVGKAYGGRSRGTLSDEFLRHTIARLMVWALGVSIPIGVLFWLGREPLLAAYTDKAAVKEAALQVFVWTAIAPTINAVAFLWDGIYLGISATRPLRNSMLACGVLVFLPLVYWADQGPNPHRLWLALTVWELSRGVSLSWQAPRVLGWAPGTTEN